jgi:hypothetical protein
MINFPGPGLTHAEYLAILKAGHETGFWDDHGNPAPWPDDYDPDNPDWRAETKINIEPGNPPF